MTLIDDCRESMKQMIATIEAREAAGLDWRGNDDDAEEQGYDETEYHLLEKHDAIYDATQIFIDSLSEEQLELNRKFFEMKDAADMFGDEAIRETWKTFINGLSEEQKTLFLEAMEKTRECKRAHDEVFLKKVKNNSVEWDMPDGMTLNKAKAVVKVLNIAVGLAADPEATYFGISVPRIKLLPDHNKFVLLTKPQMEKSDIYKAAEILEERIAGMLSDPGHWERVSTKMRGKGFSIQFEPGDDIFDFNAKNLIGNIVHVLGSELVTRYEKDCELVYITDGVYLSDIEYTAQQNRRIEKALDGKIEPVEIQERIIFTGGAADEMMAELGVDKALIRGAGQQLGG